MTDKLSIVYRPHKELLPYAQNALIHDDLQVDSIVASIVEFGWTNPILIDENDEIIAGHGRVLAAEKIGFDPVPTITLVGLTPAQKRAYRLADNQLPKNAGWDSDLLGLEISALLDSGFNVGLLGFKDEFLSGLLSTPKAGLTDPDDVPAPEKITVTKQGDIWRLGKHRVMCGDATSTDSVQKLCDGQLVDLWLTDPPYNVNYEGKTKDALRLANDSQGDTQFGQFLAAACHAADSVMKPGAVFYIWHADSEGLNFRLAVHGCGWKTRQCLIWRKNALIMGRSDYHWKHEPCLYGWKSGAAHLWAGGRKQSTILEFDKPLRSEEHPTMKPVALFETLLLNNTRGGDVILDSFGGSGTTLIASEQNGRTALLMELDPVYVDVIVRRWQDFTGEKAVDAETGQSFGETSCCASPTEVVSPQQDNEVTQ